mmetsp:Transcript_59008/g.163270  ORF Transcript_59008/g.163270 Transcript_59008/m.163270 type:complete len:298 (-) Transcript_59008:305-1198(-)
MFQCCASGSGGRRPPAAEVEILEVPEAGVTLRPRTVKMFGWVPDLPDHRDRVLDLHPSKKRDLPVKGDLRTADTFPLYNQGHLGSCTANAIGAAYHFAMIKQGLKDFTPSRLFVYYNERAMEGHVDTDSGAQIRDGIKSVAQLGVCDEKLWAYDIDRFTEKPPSAAYEAAVKCKVKEYARVEQTLDDLKACINAGFPFAFGFIVFSSFMSDEVKNTGRMKMPEMYDWPKGGHAVMGVGFNDEEKCFTIRNSWGEEWGDKGYFYMPYDYITHPALARDFWAIKCIDEEDFPTRAFTMP